RLGLGEAVQYVLVSDHGMTEISPDRVIALSSLIDLNKVQIDFTGAVAGLRPRAGVSAEEIYQALTAQPGHFSVFRKDEVPERLHFRHHRRIPPIILIADDSWFIQANPPG